MDENKDAQENAADILKGITPEQARRTLEALGAKIQSDIQSSLPHLVQESLRDMIFKGSFQESLRQAWEPFGYTEEVAGLVQLLAARSNDTKESVLMKALTLYGLALDALEKGNRLAILDPDDVIVHDVVGFEPAAV